MEEIPPKTLKNDPAIPLLDRYLKESKSLYNRDTYTLTQVYLGTIHNS
jgi:hypothetical protein